MKKIIIVGASSGMGRMLAIEYAKRNHRVGVTGRRASLLEELGKQFPSNIIAESFDNTIDDISVHLKILIEKLGGCDLLVISSGAGYLNPSLQYAIEKQTIDLNVTAWTAIADFAYLFFHRQRHGHLAAITSIAAIRGEGRAPAYNASKAYQASYMEALQKRAVHDQLPIYITDIQPGFVKTEMAKSDRRFWEASAEKAGRQIFHAIERRKKKVYVTKRWWLIAQILKIVPGFIYNRI